GFVPENFAGALIEAQQSPRVLFLFGVGITVAVEADFQLWLRARPHNGGEIDFAVPDDRAGVSETGNGRLPTDILAALAVPSRRQNLRTVLSAGLRSAELWPVGRRGVGGSSVRFDKSEADHGDDAQHGSSVA